MRPIKNVIARVLTDAMRRPFTYVTLMLARVFGFEAMWFVLGVEPPTPIIDDRIKRKGEK